MLEAPSAILEVSVRSSVKLVCRLFGKYVALSTDGWINSLNGKIFQVHISTVLFWLPFILQTVGMLRSAFNHKVFLFPSHPQNIVKASAVVIHKSPVHSNIKLYIPSSSRLLVRATMSSSKFGIQYDAFKQTTRN